MRYKIIRPLTGLLLCLMLLPLQLSAQRGERFRLAGQLMQQEKYEQAYDIYQSLLKKHPEAQVLYDRAIECLVRLKDYERAIKLSKDRINRGYARKQTMIRLGKLYHLKGDTSQAYKIWQRSIGQHSDNLRVYLQLARTLKDRREYERAIDVYKKARRKFNNRQLFSNELAFTYQLAGKYEQAIQQYLLLIKDNPNRAQFVKRSLRRFKDDYLYEVAIQEFDRFLAQLSPSDAAYQSIYNLYQWLLMEMELFERALAEARNFEQQTSSPNYAVFRVGKRLLSNKKFELAKEAFQYYREAHNKSIRRKSLERLGDVYLRWADYKSDYNLIYTPRRDSLYIKAGQMYDRLLQSTDTYEGVGRVLMKQAELALDHLKNVDKAISYYKRMQQHSQVSTARAQYIKGRIRLYQSRFDRARIAFTNSHKASTSDALSQKTRYYLALTNFYAGSFEYARLQLKALEKQSVSYYANDAIQLRLWMQDGMQQDSATTELRSFANAMHLLNHGQIYPAIRELDPLIFNPTRSPLFDDAILAVAQHSRISDLPAAYSLVTQYLNNHSSSPLHERLMWERARMAEQIVTENLQSRFEKDQAKIPAEISKKIDGVSPPKTVSEVRNLYQQLLLEHPRGFYAHYARQRIQKLQNQQT